mmetsp:Transcript_23328/g.71461  ORF Transcript_23328/g.71461 Transcript_23328/m.71461 type:complete len:81 (+) Transcript_23328:1786-2028(+)
MGYSRGHRKLHPYAIFSCRDSLAARMATKYKRESPAPRWAHVVFSCWWWLTWMPSMMIVGGAAVYTFGQVAARLSPAPPT